MLLYATIYNVEIYTEVKTTDVNVLILLCIHGMVLLFIGTKLDHEVEKELTKLYS